MMVRTAALAAAAALLAPGCSAPARTGETGTSAGAYFLGTLRADVDARIDVLTAASAAESALRARGYVMTGRSESGDWAYLRGRQARALAVDAVRIEIRHSPSGTRIAVSCEPFGDETTSRVLMEAILARLGEGAGVTNRGE